MSPRTGLPLIPKGAPRPTGRCGEAMPRGLRVGIGQFNRGEYWECHETLEEIWRVEPDPVRSLYQGILLAAVGLYHLRRGNRHGARAKLRAALARLEPYAPTCMGVDVAALRADVAKQLAALGHVGAPPAASAGQPLADGAMPITIAYTDADR